MMNDPSRDAVEIKAPPIVELNKRRSCVKRSCAIGCGGMFLFLAICASLLWLATHPRVKQLDTLPGNFPSDIPVYDKDAISSMTFISAKGRTRWVKLASFIPDPLVPPLLSALDTVKNQSVNNAERWQEFAEILKQNAGDRRDTVQIQWEQMSAQPKFVVDYYKSELKKKGYAITEQISDPNRTIFSFQKNAAVGAFFLTDDIKKDGTDSLLLIVDIVPEP